MDESQRAGIDDASQIGPLEVHNLTSRVSTIDIHWITSFVTASRFRDILHRSSKPDAASDSDVGTNLSPIREVNPNPEPPYEGFRHAHDKYNANRGG